MDFRFNKCDLPLDFNTLFIRQDLDNLLFSLGDFVESFGDFPLIWGDFPPLLWNFPWAGEGREEGENEEPITRGREEAVALATPP